MNRLSAGLEIDRPRMIDSEIGAGKAEKEGSKYKGIRHWFIIQISVANKLYL